MKIKDMNFIEFVIYDMPRIVKNNAERLIVLVILFPHILLFGIVHYTSLSTDYLILSIPIMFIEIFTAYYFWEYRSSKELSEDFDKTVKYRQHDDAINSNTVNGVTNESD